MPLHSGQAVFSDPAILSSVDGPRHSSCSGSCSDPHSVFTTGVASHCVMTFLACAEACTAIICHASFTLLSIKAYPLISLLTFSDPQLFRSDPCARLLAVKSTAWYVPPVDFLSESSSGLLSFCFPPCCCCCLWFWHQPDTVLPLLCPSCAQKAHRICSALFSRALVLVIACCSFLISAFWAQHQLHD